MNVNNNVFQDMFYYHNKIGNRDVHTIGCELSLWDGEHIAEIVEDDIIIVSTCAVTGNSQKASEMIVDRLHQIYPNKKIYITGCGVNYNPDYYKKYGICLTNEEKFDCKNYNTKQTNYTDFEHNVDDIGFVKVQDGCLNHCTYCIVNKLRHGNYSVPLEDILNQIDNHIKYGKTNIDLIGTEICNYDYNGLKIDHICQLILDKYPNIELSLNALNPCSDRIERIMDLMVQYKNMKQVLYMSVQSGSDTILKLMGRKYNRQRILDIYKYNKHVKQMWDLVIGFPGETEEYFKETLSLIKKIRPVELMMCPYSKREGAPASKLPNQIDDKLKFLREEKCRSIIHNIDDTNQYFPNERKFEIDLDLYNTNNVIEIFKFLEQSKLKLIINTVYDMNKDNDVFEINAKLLSVNFDVYYKIHFINGEPKNINDFCEYMNGIKI